MIYRTLEANHTNDRDILRLRGVYRHAWVRNQRLLNRLGDAFEALSRAGIPSMLLGGAAVIVTHYRDIGARPLHHVALLAPPPEAERAIALLRAGGWSPLCRFDPGRVLRSRHAVTLVGPDGAHLSLHARALAGSLGDEAFWSGAVSVTVGRATTLAPGPTEQLLHACAHGVSAGPDALTSIADVAVILRAAAEKIDWARLAEGVAQRGLALTITASLAVARDVLDAPIPDQIVTELGRVRSTPRERILLRLSRRPSRVSAYVQLWDMYRRQVAADDEVYSDFLRFAADATDVPSRRALVRRAMSRATASPPRESGSAGVES